VATKVAYWTGSYYSFDSLRHDSQLIAARAQEFTIDNDCDVEYVNLAMRKNNGSTITIALYTESGGEPNASQGSKSVDASGWSGSTELHTITFDTPISLTAGTYFIVGTEDSNLGTQWSRSTTGAGPGGSMRLYNGSWINCSNPESTYGFEVWASDTTPSKPNNPDPADDATDEDFSDLTLDWDDGGGADTFDVYVGDAADNLTLISSAQAGTSAVLTETQRDDLFTDHCYWRIDATNDQGTTTGDVWDFTVAGPGKATTPVPNDDQEEIYIAGIDRLTEVSWSAPAGETPTYKVYLTLPGGSPTLLETTTHLYHTLSDEILDALDYFSIYEWRVDTYDPVSELTTTGDTWTFISDKSHSFTTYSRRSDYDPDKVWEPGTGWVDINSFEYTGGGRYKGRLVVIGHGVVYFGDL
jgi:hypothetical protein